VRAAPGAVVVLRALHLGDLLTAVPALRALARAFPRRRRLLAAPAALAPLAALTGAVDAVIDTPGLVPLDPVLAGAALAVNLHGRGPRSTELLRASRPGCLIAFEVAGGPAWDDRDHERVRWCRLLEHHGIPADPEDFRLGVPAPAPAGLAALAGATIIHPGASSGARCWPAERWAAVAAAEAGAGRRVAITGTGAEAVLAASVARDAGLGPDSVLAGRTSLRELVHLVHGAGRVVCGDTGVAHLASALGRPSVVLFGPTAPARWGPPPSGPHAVLWAGQTSDPHAGAPAPGLLAIGVNDVLDALQHLGGPGGVPGPTAATR